MAESPISEASEKALPRWAQVPIAVVLGLFALLCAFASARLLFDLNRKSPLVAILLGLILLLGCFWVLEKCFRLLVGRKDRGGLMSPRTLRVVAFFLLILPIAGLFTGYYRTMGPIAVFQALMYVSGFFGLRALAREREARLVLNERTETAHIEQVDRPT